MRRSNLVVGTALLVVVLAVACAPGPAADLPVTREGPEATGTLEPPPDATATLEPYPTIDPGWQLTFEAEMTAAVPQPTATPPPLPTLTATPIVTPFPTQSPPVIPEVVGKPEQPFWIYYWQENEIWRVDDRGEERELLLDTYQELERWLTGYPHPGTDAARDSRRVSVSPDGQKLALVVLDKINLSGREPHTYSLYVFDVAAGSLQFISDGGMPVWAPDSRKLAFVPGTTAADGFSWDRGLWIADLETSAIYPLIPADPDNPLLEVSYLMWSPESDRIAYRYREDYRDLPEITIVTLDESSATTVVPNLPDDVHHWCYLWMPDGERLLCGVTEWGRVGTRTDLWAISIDTGERQQLTHDLDMAPRQWSPDGEWLLLSARALYESEHNSYDIWLLNIDESQLLRVTAAPPANLLGGWSPDGTGLVFWREGLGVVTFSLETGALTPLGVGLTDYPSYDYAVGGNR